ncbi:hypothetical protein [Streptomyces canus]|uniref:hypothetical protein n=1 Tax=Streptomyces canus TaxID=58343 RepID=UPI0033A6B405
MIDLSTVRSMAELAAALQWLRRQRKLTYRQMERKAEKHSEVLSTSTLTDMLKNHRITHDKMLIFLTVCDVVGSEQLPWVDAYVAANGGTVSTKRQSRDFFRHLISHHTALFAGRDAEAARILNFVARQRRGYVFVEALSGYGKTSLLAHLIDGHPEFSYHFISQAYRRSGSGFDPTRPEHVMESLCEQLNPGHLAGRSLPELEQEFMHLLAKPPAHPTVVVLDAIDELEPPDQLRALLPARATLPPGLVIVLSARTQGDRCHLTTVGLSIKEMDLHLTLSGLDQSALVDLLDSAGGAASQLARDDDFVKELHVVSQGDPFYLRFLVEDVARGVLTRDSVSQTPTGLEAYLDLQLDMLRRSAHRPQHVSILGFLLEAEVLSRVDLMNLVPELTWMDFDSVVAEIHRFLLVHDNEYTFCHARFRDYFKGKNSAR